MKEAATGALNKTLEPHPLNFTSTDCLITVIYYGISLAIGYVLVARVKSSTDFFAAGRELPAWLCALAVVSVSLGAQEVIGIGAAGARYGAVAASFYALGAIPAMLFAGLFLLPIYYGSKARTIPEYLLLRFDQKNHTLNSTLFAVTTLASSAISLALMARIIQALHIFDGLFRAMDWPLPAIFVFSVGVPAILVLGYVLFGGLRAAIYNQVLQFAVLVAGLLPLVLTGLKNIGGWSALVASVFPASQQQLQSGPHAVVSMETILAAFALGVVLTSGFWCTDFRILQIPMAAKTIKAASRAPLLAILPRLLLAALLVVPGLIAISLPTPHTTIVIRQENGAIFHETTIVRPEVEQGQGLVPARTEEATGKPSLDANGHPLLDYAMATPNLLLYILPTGLLGLGLTALVAALLSSISANLTAFSAVFTLDLYQPRFKKAADDAHLLKTGRWAAVAFTLLSIGLAYAAFGFGSLYGALLLVFSLVNAPILATFLLGAFWKRATSNGAFAGLMAGTLAALLHHGLTLAAAARAGLQGAWIAVLHVYPSELEQAFWCTIIALSVNAAVTVTVSLFTQAETK